MGVREWAGLGKSRTQQRIDNNLGIIPGGQVGGRRQKKYRDDRLHKLDRYFEGTQYDHLPDWDQPADRGFISVRKRKPRINYKFGQRLANEIASLLFGMKRFPALTVPDDPDTTTYIGLVLKASKLQSVLVDLARKLSVAGSGFVRFYFVEGYPKLETYHAKFCYPTFDDAGELETMDIIYTYEDEEERDERGRKVEKWAKISLGKEVDILYDNPKVEPQSDPVFEEVGAAEHNLGFVQGEWFRTNKKPNTVDGDSLLEDVLDLIDELNYSMSQTSQAIAYNQEPQLTMKGMDVDEIDKLVRSSSNAWNLGRDGEATFLESNLGAVQRAEEFRDRVRLAVQDISRIILMDPEKFGSNAQSGRALEQLMAPMLNLIEEIRPEVETSLISLVTKIGYVNLALIQQGVQTTINIPPGWVPASWNIAAEWPPVFTYTLADLNEKVALALKVSGGSLVSRETLTRWLAKDFGIEDVEAELARISAQPTLNPFGAF